MDELLRDFLTETNESIDVVDVQLVRFEQEPNNAKILGNIFRLVHTIKGTCGFLSLPRLEALTHAAEALMGKFGDGMPVTHDAVTLILATIDRIKALLGELERTQAEQTGDDRDLIAKLEQLAAGAARAPMPTSAPAPGEVSADELERVFRETERDAPPVASVSRDDEPAESKVSNQSIRVNVETLEHLMTT